MRAKIKLKPCLIGVYTDKDGSIKALEYNGGTTYTKVVVNTLTNIKDIELVQAIMN